VTKSDEAPTSGNVPTFTNPMPSNTGP
jgi:hypothetical protein